MDGDRVVHDEDMLWIDSSHLRYLLEGGIKLLGIADWLTFCVSAAIRVLPWAT